MAVFKTTTLSSASDGVTEANKAFFTSIFSEAAVGYFESAAHAQAVLKPVTSRQGWAFGPGVSTVPDTYFEREGVGILAARNAADNAFAIIRGATPVGNDDLVTKGNADSTYAAASHVHATADVTSGTFADARISEASILQHEAAIDHDALTNFVAGEHILHSSVTLTAGAGLAGGGTIAASRTFDIDINATADLIAPAVGDELLISDVSGANAIRKADLASIVNLADHDALTNFVAGEHILHSSVSVTAGAGLAGGGTIAATRTIDVDINATADLPAPAVGDELLISDASNADAIRKADLASIVNLADHDALTNFVTDEHVAHASVSVTAGAGLSGGGTIAATRTIDVDISGTADLPAPNVADELLLADADNSNAIRKADLASIVNLADHDALTNFVAGEHILHSSVTLTAGKGLTGGGTIAASRVFDIDIGSEAEDASPASGDFVLVEDTGVPGQFRKVQVGNLPGGGGGLNNVVEDTAPQLGGDLDANLFDILFDDNTGIRDSSDNELLIFQLVASAINQLEITNAAIGNDPLFAAVGGDTNIGINLVPKGSGIIQAGGVEIVTISGTQTLTNKSMTVAQLSDEGNIDHDGLTNFLLGEHVLHSGVVLTAGAGLAGGGTIEASRTFDVDINATVDLPAPAVGDELLLSDASNADAIRKADLASIVNLADHNVLTNFVAGEHILHSGVVLTAGKGLTGGGTIAASRTFDVDIGSESEDASPASGDFVLVEDTAVPGQFRKVQVGNLPGGGGGINNVVEDTAPQLGGDLDANTFDILFDNATGIRDVNDNELLLFLATVSAINHLQLANAAAGNDPILSAIGTGTDIGINLVPKGSGVVQAGGVEVVTLSGSQTLTNKSMTVAQLSDEGNIDHDGLTNFVLGEHVLHTGVVLTAGKGLTGGGAIESSRTFDVDIGSEAEDASPAANDFVLVEDNAVAGQFRKVQLTNLPGGGGINNVVEDTAPQLGGDLDANTFDILFDDATGIRDVSDNELLLFLATASAVNHLQLANAAAGNNPIFSAIGVSTDIGINLVPKGSGIVQAGGVEIVTLSGTQTLTNKSMTVAQLSDEGNIDHDGLTNFVLGEHVLHSGVVLTAGAGLAGGGTIEASRTFDVDINATTDLPAPAVGDELLISDVSNADALRKADLASIVNLADHDALTNFESDEHVAHAGVSVTAGAGLAGGGTIAATRTIDVDINATTDLPAPAVGDELLISDTSTANAIRKADLASIVNLADHNVLTNFVAGEHILHSGVTLTAGKGLTGGGTIAASRTFDLDIGSESEDVSPASGDFVLVEDTGVPGQFRKVQLGNLPGGGGLANVVEDTAPQLGGDLDANAFNILFDDNTGIRDSSDNELLIFQLVASAINQLEITNAAIGNDPLLSAVGGDTNIGINLVPKGAGIIQAGGVEIVTVSGTQTLTNKSMSVAQLSDEGNIDHDGLTNFESDEHVAHAGVSVTAGAGLAGGGTIAATRTIDVDINATTDLPAPAVGDELLISDASNADAIRKADLASIVNLADHNVLTNFVAGEHILHSGVVLTAGKGLTGGGAIEASRTFDLDFAGEAEDASPASGDFVLVEDTGVPGQFRKVQLTNLPGGGGGINNVVEDTAPQLGGDLDANTFDILFDNNTGIRDVNDNELLLFLATVSAINHLQLANAAAGNDPILSAIGTGTDIGINLVPKGSGVVQAGGVEVVTLSGSQTLTNKSMTVAQLSDEGNIDHDGLTNFVLGEHVLHSGVVLTAGDGLSGGGAIESSRTFDVDIAATSDLAAPAVADQLLISDTSTADAIRRADVASIVNLADHDVLTNYVAGQHVLHSGVVLTAGSGLAGGGAIDASRTFDLDFAGESEDASPATNDFVLVEDNSVAGQFRKVQLTNLPGGGGGINNVVEDTAPQLGGDLDANTFDILFDNNTGIRDAADNELLLFLATASAVNHLQLANAAAGNDPIFSAIGVSTDIGINLVPKGSGIIQAGGVEIVTLSGTQTLTNKSMTVAQLSDEGNIDHDGLTNHVAGQHVLHTGVLITAGDGLAGGGAIDSSRTIDVDINATADLVAPAIGDELLISDISNADAIRKADLASIVNLADHDALTNHVAGQHVLHSGVVLTAGDGLTGGGAIDASRTFDVDIDGTTDVTDPNRGDQILLADASNSNAIRKSDIGTVVDLVERSVQMVVFDFGDDMVVGNGAFFFHIDSRIAGMDLVDVHAEVITAGTTGTCTIQLRNVTQANADILSTLLSIDTTPDTGSDQATTPAVIDAAEDDMQLNDLIAVDIDTIHTGTAAKGLLITLGFRTP